MLLFSVKVTFIAEQNGVQPPRQSRLTHNVYGMQEASPRIHQLWRADLG